MPTLDMTEGVYRRIYAGFLNNKKINSVSWMAEAWFWRLVVLADDYGNLDGNVRVLSVAAAPKRDVDAELAEKLNAELIKAKLISVYRVDGDRYIHIVGFVDRQPANKNGRRIQRIPMPNSCKTECTGNPGESKIIQGNPGESGKIRVNPGESSPSDSDSDSDSDSEIQNNVCSSKATNDAESDNPSKPPKLLPKYTEAFERFWNRYPRVRRVNKVGTFKIWLKDAMERPAEPGKKRLLEFVMESLEKWIKCDSWQEGFVPLPTTWLNQKRWSNDPPTKEKPE